MRGEGGSRRLIGDAGAGGEHRDLIHDRIPCHWNNNMADLDVQSWDHHGGPVPE